MKWRNYYLIVFCLLSIYSCSLKTRNILHGGLVKNVNFTEEIPFDFSYGIPIIEVDIQENTYRFLLDTGAPTVITPELAALLNSEEITKEKVFDSQGNKEKESFIKIKKLSISSIDFEDIGAAVSDINQTFEISCLHIDGIIGANLMEKIYWKIDYAQKKISLSDSSFPLDGEHFEIDFKPQKNQATPKITITINSKKIKNISLDTGSNGGFDFESKDHSKIAKDSEDLSVFGTASTGVYGRGEDAIKLFSKVKTLELGDLDYKNQIVSFEKNTAKTLGNDFLQHFTVLLDWKKKKIYLFPESTYSYGSVEGFGFYTKIEDGKLKVAAVVQNSMAAKMGISPNTEILQIENTSFRNTIKNPCYYAFHSSFPLKEKIKVTFLLEGKPKTFVFYKKVFL